MNRLPVLLLLLLPLVVGCGGGGGDGNGENTGVSSGAESGGAAGGGTGSESAATPSPTPAPTPSGTSSPTPSPTPTPAPTAPDFVTIGFAFFAPNPVSFGGSSSFSIKVEEVSDPTRMKELHWSNAATATSGVIAINGAGFTTPAYLSADIPAVAFPGSYTVEGWVVMEDGAESNHVTATVTVTL